MSKLVFIPGIKGSQLWDGEHKRWYPSTVDDIASLVVDNELLPGSAIGRVTIPWPYKTMEIYESFLDKYSDKGLDVFTYDWRKSVYDHLKDFDRFLRTIHDENITVVAHSMGGMLLKAYLLNNPSAANVSKIKQIITIGTPWLGAPYAYRALMFGELLLTEEDNILKVFNMERDLQAQLLAQNYPSVYELLPSPVYHNHDAGKFLIKADGSYATYSEIVDSLSSIQKSHYTTYATRIHKDMAVPLPFEIPHYALIGYGYATLQAVTTKASQRKYMKRHSEFFNGDFTVPLISSRTPHEAREFYVAGQHSTLCSIPETLCWLDWVLDGAQGEPPVGISTEIPPIRDYLSKKKAYIMCPVGYTVTDKEGHSLAGDLDPENVDLDKVKQYADMGFYSHRVGDAKYLFFTRDDEQEIKITAYDTGLANVTVVNGEQSDASGTTGTFVFQSVPVDPKTVMRLSVPKESTIEPTLRVSNSEVKETPVDKALVKPLDIVDQPLPKVQFLIQPAPDVKKFGRKTPIFSGNVQLSFTGSVEHLLECFWMLNDSKPVRYTEKMIVQVEDGVNRLEFFARDIWGRGLPPQTYEFIVDRKGPVSVPIITFDPDGGVRVGIRAESQVDVRESKYRWIRGDEDTTDWQSTTASGVKFDSISSIFGPTQKARLEYYSIDKLNRHEIPKTLTLNVQFLENVLWGETATASNALTIYREIFGVTPEDLTASVQTKNFTQIEVDEDINDSVRAVKLASTMVDITINFMEQYSLFWSGPPTEVITRGKSYNFAFQLLTDYKLPVVDTSPIVRYFALSPNSKRSGGTTVATELEEGVFTGSFGISEDYSGNKIRLVVTDSKHKSPPLRETIIMIED